MTPPTKFMTHSRRIVDRIIYSLLSSQQFRSTNRSFGSTVDDISWETQAERHSIILGITIYPSAVCYWHGDMIWHPDRRMETGNSAPKVDFSGSSFWESALGMVMRYTLRIFSVFGRDSGEPSDLRSRRLQTCLASTVPIFGIVEDNMSLDLPFQC